MRGGNGLQGLQKLLPQGSVFLLGGRVLCGFAFFARLGKDGLGRERFQRVAPLQAFQAVRLLGRGADVHLLQQRQQPCLVVVAPGRSVGVALLRGVVGIKRLALKAAGQAVGAGDDPLQKSVGPVVRSGGVDQRIGLAARLQLMAVDERRHVAVDQVGGVALNVVKRQRGVGRVDVAVVAVFAPRGGAVPGAVLGFVRCQRVGRHVQAGTFGKFTQVMQVGGQGHPARGMEPMGF